ncbi:hypothetical protein EVG20_g2660 [Dentipellis fragilis]|uniref:Uncharacterized protein n=1 Tax=Dentipellis fragilis TaxID=205917 RepID=A0A4Y9ZAC6_9AGAM|nr:hypothetical protein EVG20_g2660 [Dentipellis fragilis]
MDAHLRHFSDPGFVLIEYWHRFFPHGLSSGASIVPYQVPDGLMVSTDGAVPVEAGRDLERDIARNGVWYGCNLTERYMRRRRRVYRFSPGLDPEAEGRTSLPYAHTVLTKLISFASRSPTPYGRGIWLYKHGSSSLDSICTPPCSIGDDTDTQRLIRTCYFRQLGGSGEALSAAMYAVMVFVKSQDATTFDILHLLECDTRCITIMDAEKILKFQLRKGETPSCSVHLTTTMTGEDPQNFGCSVHAYRYAETTPDGQDRDSDFNISAHFDGGSERYFSGFRIALVCKKSDEELVDLTVVDRDHDAASLNGQILPEDVSSTVSNSHSYSENQDRSPYVVVYEIINEHRGSYMLLDIDIRSPQLLDDKAYRVVYEHSHLCTSVCPSTSVMLSLKANRAFCTQIQQTESRDAAPYVPKPQVDIRTYGIRILPQSSSRQPFKHPPPEILCLIFSSSLYSGNEIDDHWQELLLSFGLVCRAWVHALDLLYEDFSDGNGGWPSPNLNCFAAALRLNPARASAIRRFSTLYFNHVPRPGETNEQASQSLIDILSAATLVQELKVADVVVDHKDMCMQALRGCTEVREFGIAKGYRSPGGGPQVYTPALSDVIQCMAHWPHLRALSISQFIAGHIDSGSSLSDKPDAVPYPRLEHLLLLAGEISGRELLCLTSSSLSSLKKVTFGGLTGLTHASLKEWLRAVSPTLEELEIGRCTIRRENDYEAFAIDAVIGEMDKLHNLSLHGDFYSGLVFTRKAKKPRSSITHRITLVGPPPDLFAEDFLGILEHTGWEGITLLHVDHEDPGLIERAQKVAEEHGIQLLIH